MKTYTQIKLRLRVLTSEPSYPDIELDRNNLHQAINDKLNALMCQVEQKTLEWVLDDADLFTTDEPLADLLTEVIDDANERLARFQPRFHWYKTIMTMARRTIEWANSF